MAEHIIAIETYGSQRIQHPTTSRRISAYKMSYTSAVTPVLLALYGTKAHDVSSRQASYRYVEIDEDVMVRHGYILLTLTAQELASAEQLTRQSHRAAVFLWRDRKWWEFPTTHQPEYAEPLHRSGPTFDPTGFRPPSPSTEARESIVEGILAERSERDEDGRVWWWLTGDTYPHRELLKRCGARFSGKRKAWYYRGEELPTAIAALMVQPNPSDTNATHPLLALFGGRIERKERTSNDDMILHGANRVFATRTTWLDPDDQVAVLDELAVTIALDEAQPAAVQRSTIKEVIPIMSPELASMIEEVLAADDNLPSPDSEAGETPLEGAVPSIRVTKPVPIPEDAEGLDAIQTAIREMKHQPLAFTSSTQRSRTSIVSIEQTYCGELTGSITGQVYCYGYAVHDGIAVYINMAGPRMAVEAIRAKLSKGEQISLVPPDAPSVELTSGEGNSGMYHAYLHYLPEARFASLILVHDWVVTPNYGGKATTFIFRTDDSQAMAKLKHQVTQLVNIPVFDDWTVYLYEAGQRAMLIRTTRSAGGIDLLSIDLDIDAWTRLIMGGLEQGVISLPHLSTESKR